MNYGKLTATERQQINTDALAKVTVNAGYVDAFKPVFKAWRSEYGSKPTAEMITAAVLLANKHQRPGVECLYIAMLMRPEGCISQTQYQLAAVPFTGKAVGPANNKRKALVNGKAFHETSLGGKPAALHLVLMSGGIKQLETYQAAQAAAATPNAEPKPVKVKKAKAKKAKAKVTEPAVAETAEPVQGEPELTITYSTDSEGNITETINPQS